MDFTVALINRLLADSGVAAIVGTRIYWGIVPQNTPLPFVRLVTISDPRPAKLDGYDTARESRVQADCFGASYGQARSLALAIIEATEEPATVGGTVFGRVKAEGPRDLGEDTAQGFIHRASIDLLVEHREA